MEDLDRPRLGRIGLWAMPEEVPMPLLRDAVGEAEELGFESFWFGTFGGREALTTAAILLGATRTMAVGTGIATVVGQDPATMARSANTIAEAYPDRFVLGLGGHRVANPGRSGGQSPVAQVAGFLDGMDAASYSAVAPARPPHRMLAALGPKMLELAARRTSGVLSYLVPVDHTRVARRALGPDPVLAVEVGVILERDDEVAHHIAHRNLEIYLQAPHQSNNLRRLGYGPELDAGRVDRLIGDLFVWGDLDSIKARVDDHFDAGADHVCVQVLTVDPTGLPLEGWRALAPTLFG